MNEIALDLDFDFDDDDKKGKHTLLPSPAGIDGASSSSSKKKKKEKKEDKKGKLAVKVTCKICDDGIILFF